MNRIVNNIKNLLLVTIVILSIRCSKESTVGGAAATGAGGSTARFTIVGNYLYAVDNKKLKSFDISNTSTSPVLRATTDIGLNIETIFPYQDKLFIGSSTTMYIFSLTNPDKPVQIGKAEYIIRMSCDPVVAIDSTAYATLNGSSRCGGSTSALVVYDIKNPNSPQFKTQLSLSGPYGLGVRDSALYVCEGVGGLNVYNIRNTYSPQYVRRITGETFFDVIPYGNILICQVSNGISLYDISNRHQPVLLSRILN